VVDGVIFAFTEADPSLYERYTKRDVPVIHINRVHPEWNYVAVDNYLGMETLLRRVVEGRGTKKPCFIGFSPVAYICPDDGPVFWVPPQNWVSS